MFDIIFFLFFAVVIGIFFFQIGKGLLEWHKNNNSPRLSVDAGIVAKRENVSTSHHNNNGHMHVSHSTTYYVTFQVASGDRMEFRVPAFEYGLLVEGDRGTLTFQGTRYIGFERSYM